MKLKAFIGGIRRNNRTRESGWTFGELLVVAGVIATLAIGGFIIYTQLGSSSEMRQLAGQIGERAGGQYRMIDAGLRSGTVSEAEFAGSVGSVVSKHKFMTGGGVTAFNPPGGFAVAAQGAACSGTGLFGIEIRLAAEDSTHPGALSQSELPEFAGQIIAAMKTALPDLTMASTFSGGSPTHKGLEESMPPVFSAVAGTASTIFLCLSE